MKKNKPKNKSDAFFWETAEKFLNHELPAIRKKSQNTVLSYRASLNAYIDYLEDVKNYNRANVCFEDFNKDNLKDYLLWMDKTKKWEAKTCNLRMTAIRSMLSFASEESIDITPIYVACKNVKGLKVTAAVIEYFENYQLAALLSAPATGNKTERRNQTMLIVTYDAALRVSELISLNVGDFYFDAVVPYVSILGKGSKYRNMPLMNKTVSHLKKYLAEFHKDMDFKKPLFYAVTHGKIHSLSDDAAHNVLKKYADRCRENNVHMPEYVHFHMLRKTRAMDLYRAGCPLSYIQQMLGHTNISTTSGFYAFATLDALAEALEKVNPDLNENEKIWKNENIRKKLYRL
jgi:site-specific recombinase XerD